jgi:hypothetical protein
VYADLAVAPDFVLVHVGNFTDPTFPPPIISGFEASGHPWAKKTDSELPMPEGRHDYDGTSHGGPRM